jgi:hypothetical protein
MWIGGGLRPRNPTGSIRFGSHRGAGADNVIKPVMWRRPKPPPVPSSVRPGGNPGRRGVLDDVPDAIAAFTYRGFLQWYTLLKEKANVHFTWGRAARPPLPAGCNLLIWSLYSERD